MITAAIVIELALKSAFVAGGVLFLLRVARNRSAAQRSWLAHLGLLGLVLLPAAVFLLPSWNPMPETLTVAADKPASLDGPVSFPALADAGEARATAPPAQITSGPAAVRLPTAGELAVWAYLIPAVFLLLAMLIAVLRLGAMHRRANVLVDSTWLSALAQAQRRMGFKHGTALLVSPDLRSPVSWGLMRPIILLSDDTVDAAGEAEAIIAHELAHVARLDWAKLLLSRLACALFWFNPLVWRLAREAHQLREETADDAVLLSEVDDAAYATLLVNAARHDNKALLIAAHGVAPAKDSLKRRITRVLDRDTARGPASGAWSAMCVASLLAVAAPLAAFDPSAQGPESASLVAEDAASSPALEKLPGSRIDRQVDTVASTRILAGVKGEEARQPDIARRGRGNQEIDDLVSYKAVGMTPEYIDSIRRAGFADADMEQLLEARAVGVTPEFARQIRRWDPSATLEEVSEARAIGLNAATYGEMHAIFPDAGVEELSQLQAVGVSPGYAREMRTLFPEADADDLTEMKAVGVTPAFVREMRRKGIAARDADEVIEARVMSYGQQGARGANRMAIKRADGAAVSIGPNGIAVAVPPVPPGAAAAPTAPPAPPAPPARTR